MGQLLDRKAFFRFCSPARKKEMEWKSYWLVVVRHTQLAKQIEQPNSKPRLATVLLGNDFWTSVYPFVRLKVLLVPNFEC